MADGLSGLQIISIEEGIDPFLESTYPGTGEDCTTVTVSGNYAYLTQNGSWGYLQIVDVSNPSQPVGVKFDRRRRVGS